MNLELSKRNFLALLAGLVIIILIGIVTSTASFHQLYLAFRWILQIITFISPMVGGFVVGWLVKERGWLYGGLLGLVLTIISIAIVSWVWIVPEPVIYGPDFSVETGKELAQKNIVNQLFETPLTLLLAALGGYLGESLRRNRNKR